MDRNTITFEHSIRRTVAVLLALGDLAECAGGRSAAVRGLVLWLLRSGEVLAQNYLAGLTLHVSGHPFPLLCPDDGADGATRLAARFRNLAAAFTALAAEILAPPLQAVAPLSGKSRVDTLAASYPLAALRAPTTAVGRRDSS